MKSGMEHVGSSHAGDCPNGPLGDSILVMRTDATETDGLTKTLTVRAKFS
jgi:hypothetical protein